MSLFLKRGSLRRFSVGVLMDMFFEARRSSSALVVSWHYGAIDFIFPNSNYELTNDELMRWSHYNCTPSRLREGRKYMRNSWGVPHVHVCAAPQRMFGHLVLGRGREGVVSCSAQFVLLLVHFIWMMDFRQIFYFIVIFDIYIYMPV